jgi:hypothetical protein
MMIRSALLLALLCAGPALAQDAWRFDANNLTGAERCVADGERHPSFRPIGLDVTPVSLAPDGMAADLPDGVSFTGGWHLTSGDKHFGGLSGLALTPAGWLSVTDTGRFVQLGRSLDAPDGRAWMTPMRFPNALIRPGKLTSDAEGLDVRDGVALVSFERDFRVLAFDLRGCTDFPTGVRIATPPKRFGKAKVRANAGPEALSLDGTGGLHMLYEQPREGRAVSVRVEADGSATLGDAGLLEADHRPVGLDHLTRADGREITARLFRAYDRERGNRLRLEVGETVIALAPPLHTDNFEGVVLEDTPSGVRAWIVSDDNFSQRQRALLYAFDVAVP